MELPYYKRLLDKGGDTHYHMLYKYHPLKDSDPDYIYNHLREILYNYSGDILERIDINIDEINIFVFEVNNQQGGNKNGVV